MKKALTIICFSWLWIFATASDKSPGILCGDEISVIQSLYQINYGDTISTGISSEEPLTVSWNVLPKTGLNISSGSGMMTGDLIFSQPGEYQITFNIPAHGDHPAKSEIIQVKVSSVRMTFNTKNIVLSKKISAGDVTGVTMTIPVTVKTYDGKSIDYSTREIKTTGVANITTRLKANSAKLKNGQNDLTFELSGSVSNSGSVQFRFYDLGGNATFYNYYITQ